MLAGVKRFFLYEPKDGFPTPKWYIHRNKYVRSFLSLFAIFATSLVYYGWQRFSYMLFKAGAYGWLCNEASEIIVDEDLSSLYCQAQYDAVQTLFTVGISSEYIFGVLAGWLFDRFGPLRTAMFGYAVALGGWMMLAVSNEYAQLYIPAFILIGSSINLVCFPVLCISDFFPRYAGLCVSLVLAAQLTGTLISPLMALIWDANPQWYFSTIVWGFILIVMIPCITLIALCLPVYKPSLTKADAVSSVKSIRDSDFYNNDVVESKSGEDIVEPESNEQSVSELKLSEVVVETPTDTTPASNPYTFLQQIFSIDYILFTAYYVFQILQYGYYPTFTLNFYGKGVSTFQAYFLPTQGAIGLFFGLFVDRTGTLNICYSLVLSMIIAYGLVFFSSVVALGYIGSALYVISNAYIYTVKYTYTLEMYPPLHYGVLVGLIGCVAGAANLCNIPLQNWNEVVVVSAIYVGVGFVCLALVVYLHKRQRQGKSYKAIAKD